MQLMKPLHVCHYKITAFVLTLKMSYWDFSVLYIYPHYPCPIYLLITSGNTLTWLSRFTDSFFLHEKSWCSGNSIVSLLDASCFEILCWLMTLKLELRFGTFGAAWTVFLNVSLLSLKVWLVSLVLTLALHTLWLAYGAAEPVSVPLWPVPEYHAGVLVVGCFMLAVRRIPVARAATSRGRRTSTALWRTSRMAARILRLSS